jgi:hypothetical protein
MVREYNHEKDNEKLWWVRYSEKRDLERQDGSMPEQKSAFFYALDEQALDKHLAGWLHHMKHDCVMIQAIEQVPLGFHLHFFGKLQPVPKGSRILMLVERVVG